MALRIALLLCLKASFAERYVDPHVTSRAEKCLFTSIATRVFITDDYSYFPPINERCRLPGLSDERVPPETWPKNSREKHILGSSCYTDASLWNTLCRKEDSQPLTHVLTMGGEATPTLTTVRTPFYEGQNWDDSRRERAVESAPSRRY